MASLPALSPEQELHLQSAFILASAVDAFDPILVLKDKIELHNFTEYNIYESGTSRCLLALSSNAIKFGPNTRSDLQIQPTVFIAFSNSLRHPSHEVPGQMSMANFLAAQRQCGFPGATACNVQGHALAALDDIPLGVVFSLLGQGYKLVTSGHKFGGVVAHLFATRVLLQLNQEVQMARQMGINLSMSLADNKVSSYAFGSPFFATSSLTRALTALDLQPNQHVNLHTLWRAGDGSPAFFAAASELYTVAAAARDSALETSGATESGEAAASDDVNSASSLARTPQICAVQEWCRYVGDGVDALSRCRASGPSRLLARPLEGALLARVTAPGGLLAPPPTPPPEAADASAVVAAAGAAADKLQGTRLGDGGDKSVVPRTPSMSLVTRSGSITAGRTSSITAGRSGSVTAPRQGSVTAGGSVRAGVTRRRSMEKLDAGAPPSPSGGSTTAGTGRVKRAGSVTESKPAAGGKQGFGVRAGAKPSAWRDGLLKLLQVMGDGLGERYAPVGRFWILGTVPSDKDKDKPAPAGSLLQPIEGSKAMQSSAAWLSPGNSAGIFSRWESEIEELERELMEAFAWVTFMPCVDVRGSSSARRDLLRQSASLDLGAV